MWQIVISFGKMAPFLKLFSEMNNEREYNRIDDVVWLLLFRNRICFSFSKYKFHLKRENYEKIQTYTNFSNYDLAYFATYFR